MPDDIRPYSIVSEWSPLFEEAVDLGENYSIVCLRNAVQLKDEGSALSHCVGGYSSACQSGKTQILSLKYNGVSRATIELTASQRSEVAFPKGSTWAKMQFKGRNNSNPSPQDEAAFERFKYLVQDGKVEENKRAAQIAIRNMQISGLGIIERTIGFDLRDFKSVRERALAHYDQRVVVEGGGKTYTLLSTDAKARLDKWFASLKGQDSQ